MTAYNYNPGISTFCGVIAKTCSVALTQCKALSASSKVPGHPSPESTGFLPASRYPREGSLFSRESSAISVKWIFFYQPLTLFMQRLRSASHHLIQTSSSLLLHQTLKAAFEQAVTSGAIQRKSLPRRRAGSKQSLFPSLIKTAIAFLATAARPSAHLHTPSGPILFPHLS